uniref:Uncharacterized protein n=1 Tax=Panagrolaimus sp. PS1159 TaxID=55785 RepID=A0AC35EZ22_9BILA
MNDLEYDVNGHDSAEKSAQRVREFCSETTFDQQNYVVDLIVQSGSNCTDAHLNKDSYGSDDLHYLIDFDSGFLGDDPDTYRSNSESIRKEYSHLNDKDYREQRLKLLQLFIQIPNIFATKEFREKYEKQARENIATEIELLKEE